MIGLRLLNPRVNARLISRNYSHFISYRSPIFTSRSFTTFPRKDQQLNQPSDKKEPVFHSPRKDHDDSKIALKKQNLDISTEIYTVPNLLTLSRIAATPFIGYFLATGNTTPAIAIFTYSCVTDFVDGFIARRFNMKSVLGSILDPAADKFLMTTCTVALAIPGSMPLYVASAIIGRDVILSFISFYVRYKSLPPPVTLTKFLDMSITTHTVHPNLLGKVNTAFQMLYIGALVIKPAIESYWVLDLAQTFHWAGLCVAVSTICSGLSYVIRGDSFKTILKTGTK